MAVDWKDRYNQLKGKTEQLERENYGLRKDAEERAKRSDDLREWLRMAFAEAIRGD